MAILQKTNLIFIYFYLFFKNFEFYLLKDDKFLNDKKSNKKFDIFLKNYKNLSLY
jgi:hypothetical protein